MTLVLVIFNKICYSYVNINDRGDSMAKNHFIPSQNDIDEDSQISVNEKNSREFQNLIEHSQRKYDDYWDINNPVIRVVLIILFLVAAIGSAYYIITWLR